MRMLICLMLCLATVAHAQVDIDEVLGHMPAKDGAAAQWAFSTLAENVKQNTTLLAQRLAKAGENTDINVRLALGGLANHVLRPGAPPAERADYNAALCEALPSAPDDEAKAFLMQMLRTTGDDAAVPCVAQFLKGSDRLASEARYTLEAIGGAAAAQALTAGPPAAADYPRNTSVMEPPPGAEAFLEEYKAQEPGSASARGVLFKGLQSEFATTRAAAIDIAAKEFPGEMNTKRIARLLKDAPAPMAPDYLTLIGRRGGETALKVLPEYLNSEDPRTREAAAGALSRINTPEADAALLAWLNAAEPGQATEDAHALVTKVAARLMPKPDADGFVPIFNGENLDGWTGWTRGYAVEDGAIVCKGAGLNLYTKRAYTNFVLRFEFKLTPAANNGIGIRAPLKGKASEEGMEIQVIDDTYPKHANIHDWQVHGSIYGIVPAKRGFLRPVGEWNEQEISAEGSHITVVLNGDTIVDADIAQAIAAGAPDGKDHSGALRTRGHIGFLGHGDEVWYRNLRVKESK